MASNLAGGLNIGQFNACVVRVAALDNDCTILGGVNSGWVTTGLVTMTATPDVEEGTVFEPKTACGSIAYTFEDDDKIKRYNIAGEFIFFDWEGAQLMFGGSVILGAAGGPFAGQVIGWSAPNYNAPTRNGVYLEVIRQGVAEGSGDCITSGSGFPVFYGYAFGKVKMTPGEFTFENDVARFPFTGKATSNPNLFDGPWDDYPGAGYMANSALSVFGYTADEYALILASAGAGLTDLPVGS